MNIRFLLFQERWKFKHRERSSARAHIFLSGILSKDTLKTLFLLNFKIGLVAIKSVFGQKLIAEIYVKKN